MRAVKEFNMGVFRQSLSPYWYFEIRQQGRRLFVSTRTTNRQEAEAIERTERERVKRIGIVAAIANPLRLPPPLSPRYRGLCACGTHSWAVLTSGYVTFVSPEDAHLLERTNCYVVRSGKKGIYAARKGRLLHCEILGEKIGVETDHKNHVGTDNRRSNLRPCSSSQNNASKRCLPNASGFRGVSRNHGGWQGKIGVHNKDLYLGTFKTPEEAARAYDAAAVRHFGEFASLNFPLGNNQEEIV